MQQVKVDEVSVIVEAMKTLQISAEVYVWK